MTAALTPDSLLVGIDVAKDKIDVARSDDGSVLTLANDEKGFALLIQTFAPARPALIVVEATGGYEKSLVGALLDAHLPVAVAHPGHVRHLARGLGILAKTDALDARVLLAYARHAQPRLVEKRSKNREELEALVTCRRQLNHVQTEQNNRLRTTRSQSARKAIEAVLKTTLRQIELLDEQIRKLIESDDDMHRQDRIIRSVPGVGPVLSATLLSSLQELGSTHRRQAAALIGVAPYNRDSGRFSGKRAIRGGRTAVRSVLYMATLVAMRHNAVIRDFAQRLKATGKANKVVIVACMRKLAAILNAMLRDGLLWSELKLAKTTHHT